MKAFWRAVLALTIVGGSAVAGVAPPAQAIGVSATVLNNFVCSTATGRCYQQNPAFNKNYKCHISYWVDWSITAPYKSLRDIRTDCIKGWG